MTTRSEALQKAIDRQNEFFDQQEKKLNDQFIALETTISQLQTTATYLSAQLAGINGDTNATGSFCSRPLREPGPRSSRRTDPQMSFAQQAYRRSTQTQWSRIDLLVALYSATERTLLAGAQAIEQKRLRNGECQGGPCPQAAAGDPGRRRAGSRRRSRERPPPADVLQPLPEREHGRLRGTTRPRSSGRSVRRLKAFRTRPASWKPRGDSVAGRDVDGGPWWRKEKYSYTLNWNVVLSQRHVQSHAERWEMITGPAAHAGSDDERIDLQRHGRLIRGACQLLPPLLVLHCRQAAPCTCSKARPARIRSTARRSF